MKSFTKIVVTFTILILVLFAVSLVLPSSIRISHTELILGKRNTVYSLIEDMSQWEKWCVWMSDDKPDKATYSANPSGIGAFYSWEEGARMETGGKIELTNIIPKTRVDFIINSGTLQPIYSSILLEDTPNGTKATWDIATQLPGSGSRLLGFLLKGWLRRDIKKSLRNINGFLIENGQSTGILIDSGTYVEQKKDYDLTLTVWDTIRNRDLDSIAKVRYVNLLEEAGNAGMEVKNYFYFAPMYRIDQHTTVYEFGVNIEDSTGYRGTYAIKRYEGDLFRAEYIGSSIGFDKVLRIVKNKARSKKISLKEPPFFSYYSFPPGKKDLADSNKIAISYFVK